MHDSHPALSQLGASRTGRGVFKGAQVRVEPRRLPARSTNRCGGESPVESLGRWATRFVKNVVALLRRCISSPRLHAIVCLVLGLPETKNEALAQSPKLTVSVLVSDTVRKGLADVEVFLIRDTIGAVVGGRTDAGGRYVFAIDAADSGHYAVAARKVGFSPARTDVPSTRQDTVHLELVLLAVPAIELGPVRIAAAPPGKNYFLDSAEIARTTGRTIRNAYDALRKLRPDMLGDRGRCKEPVDNVWVNGRRVLWMARFQPGYPSTSALTSSARRGTVVRVAAPREPATVDSVLASIKSEHIAEIRYVNCWDHSMAGMGTNNAVFVVLKPGVAFDRFRGSYVDTADTLPRRPPQRLELTRLRRHLG
jgi:hypothetical protein